MLSSPVYAELDPRQHLLPPSAASAPSAFSQPSNFQPSNRLRSNSFPCHTSGKCAHNSCVCHTSKNTRFKVLCLPHIRKTGGWGPLNPTEDPIFASLHSAQFRKVADGLSACRTHLNAWRKLRELVRIRAGTISRRFRPHVLAPALSLERPICSRAAAAGAK
jgi:hypothetical protein